MRVTRQMDHRELRRLYQTEEPRPVDVLNLIRFRNRTLYNVYGMMMLPTLKAIGASVRWAGTHAHAISGEPQSEELIVVRYPRIRRFIQMAMNPVYLTIANPVRRRGVEYFEASFTTPEEPAPFHEEPWIAVVHHDGDDEASQRMRSRAAASGGRHVYSSKEFSPLSFLRHFRPTDPNPLTFKRVAFFAFPSREDALRGFTAEVIADVEASTRGASIQLYRRSMLRDFIPRPRN